MSEADRDIIAKSILGRKEQKIILTHGTDTMHQTAAFLAKNPELASRCIILVGASRPEVFKDSDASFNIAFAMGALNHAPQGIFIAMHGKILPWEDSRKNPETGHFEPIRT